MIEFIKVCGLFGLLSLLTTVALLIGFFLVMPKSGSRGPSATFCLLALLPLLFGVLGTALGYASVNAVEEDMAEPSPLS